MLYEEFVELSFENFAPNIMLLEKHYIVAYL
jgi:hypothetical protein